MLSTHHALKITDTVYWVGAIDWNLRDFHGYLTGRGTTYNAFLIVAGGKVVLIDTVKQPFKDEMLSRIASVVSPEKIDIIVSNHAEMDHTGCLPEVIALARPDKVYTSRNGARDLKQHFDLGAELTPVADGEVLDLGAIKLTFIHSAMLHWPDSMLTWYEAEGILFSQDAFGMHLASSERFDDEVAADILDYEASKYYANILLPYSPLVARLLAKVQKMNLPLKMIAPDHGPVWRKDPARVLGLYAKWADRTPGHKAVIIYDTMWQSTAKMASAVEDGLLAAGAPVKRLSLSVSHRSDVATEILDAGALLVGSPTLNSQMYPTVADVLTYLTGLIPGELSAAAFGSYGWNPLAIGHINRAFEAMQLRVVHPGLTVKYVPKAEDLQKCHDLGRMVGEAIRR